MGLLDQVTGLFKGLVGFLTQVGPTVPPFAVAALAAAGALVVSLPLTWEVVKYFVAFAHESGHALAAVATGREVKSLRIHADGSGLLESEGLAHRAGVNVTTFAGYPAPGVAGCVLVVLASSGYQAPALAMAVVVLFLVWLILRTVVAAVVAAVITALTAVFIAYPGDLWVAWALVLAGSVLVFGGIRSLVGELRARALGAGTDFTSLRARTGIPAPVWWFACVVVYLSFITLAAFVVMSFSGVLL